MSLSDKVKDDFTPINLTSLEIHEEAKSRNDGEPDLDWEKFKIVFEELKTKPKETDLFVALINQKDVEKEKEAVAFEQFGGKKREDVPAKSDSEIDSKIDSEIKANADEELTLEEEQGSQGSVESKTEEKDAFSEDLDAESVQDESEVPGYEQGYEQGIEDGKKEGSEKGFEQGQKDGHEQGLKDGHAEGFKNGEKEAAQAISDKIDEKTKEFEAILLKLDNTYPELAGRYEEKLISLVCSIAERVVLAKVEIDDEIVKESVLDALKTLPEPEDITLSVSEEDYEYIEMVKEDLFDTIGSLKSVFVKSDSSVNRGGCRIETKEGYIETDIETKLEKIFSSVKGKNTI